jgi:hypothetical protein
MTDQMDEGHQYHAIICVKEGIKLPYRSDIIERPIAPNAPLGTVLEKLIPFLIFKLDLLYALTVMGAMTLWLWLLLTCP